MTSVGIIRASHVYMHVDCKWPYPKSIIGGHQILISSMMMCCLINSVYVCIAILDNFLDLINLQNVQCLGST